MRCEIQWIDVNGKATPDDNEAIGHADCVLRTYVGGGVQGVPIGTSQRYPICAHHAERMGVFPDGHGGYHRPSALRLPDWTFYPLAQDGAQ